MAGSGSSADAVEQAGTCVICSSAITRPLAPGSGPPPGRKPSVCQSERCAKEVQRRRKARQRGQVATPIVQPLAPVAGVVDVAHAGTRFGDLQVEVDGHAAKVREVLGAVAVREYAGEPVDWADSFRALAAAVSTLLVALES